ncbi:hypothetical protein AB0O57_01295 [Streptomyces sp. NPDC091201]|uniref:hypothetical protein n=1 Tax=Streptomyces sp. NPDC091201 TaxID=3155190 RepID=UPI00342B71BE
MTDTAERLLAALDPLPHAARLRLAAVTARRLADRDELAPLLAELDLGGPHERRLAALAALTGGAVPHLAARLADPDPVVRRYALRGAHRLPVPDAAVEAAYEDAPPVVRAGLARLLRDGGRTALAERLLPRLRREYGDRDAAAVLAGCSTAFVRRHLPFLADAVPFEGWGRLAARHPLPVVEHAERELPGLPAKWRQGWWDRHGRALGAALPAAPARLLALIEDHGPGTLPGPVMDRLDLLVAVDAERVARRLADGDHGDARRERTPPAQALRLLARAAPPSLPRLAVRWLHREAFTTLIAATPPARRLALAQEATALFRYGTIPLPDTVLDLLPAAQRLAEAEHRLAQCTAAGGTRWDRLDVLALLPPDRARPELLAALPGSDADDRERLWSLLVQNAGRTGDPAEVAAVLALAADRLRNDRDAVRREFVDSLAALPAGLAAAALAPGAPGADGPAPAGAAGALDRLCQSGLSAADSTQWTRSSIRDLALELLGRPGPPAADPAPAGGVSRALCLAARVLEALAEHTGRPDLGDPGSLAGPAREGHGDAVLDALRPWLDRAEGRGDHGPLIATAVALGPPGHRVPALQDRLARALRSCPDADFPRLAGPWLGDRATRGERAARLLDADPSAAVVAPVLAVLTADRTDLLDLALGEAAPSGRFPAPGTERALPDLRDADRWLPRQQRAAVRLVAAAVADARRPPAERAALLRSVALVPVHGPALAARYLPSGRPAGDGAAEPVLVRAALEASGRAEDSGDALATLLAHAGADGAATAWAAAVRVAHRTPPGRLAPVLEELLAREDGVKVTVRKTAARLAASHLPPERALPLLIRTARDPRAHVDVRAAVTALLPSFADERAWHLLEETVADGPAASRLAMAQCSPPELPLAHRARFGALVARLAASEDEEVAARAMWLLDGWAAYAPEVLGVVHDGCTDLSAPDDRARSALQRLCEILRSGLPHPLGGAGPGGLLHGVVSRLLEAVAAGEPQGRDPHEGGDLPARRRLEQLAGSLYATPELYAPLAEQLAGTPDLAPLRAGLLVRAVDLTAPAPRQAAALRALTDAAAGRPVLAGQLARALEEHLRYGEVLDDPGPALDALATLGDGLAEGLFAVALGAALGQRQKWPEPCRTAVLDLRHHPEPEVRDAACAVRVGRP